MRYSGLRAALLPVGIILQLKDSSICESHKQVALICDKEDRFLPLDSLPVIPVLHVRSITYSTDI